MRIAIFCHSLVSDWNNGNAHFLRGVTGELMLRGHEVGVYEPVDSWSRCNLTAEYGDAPIRQFRLAYPHLKSVVYDPADFDLDAALDGVSLVLVHEWNTPELVKRIGEHRERTGGYKLLFHDTHHRSATDPDAMAAYDLSGYDGVLAFGSVVRDLYLQHGLAARAWTWHEAADTRVFQPLPGATRDRDVVWIGNWGDEERSAELREFLFEPVRALGLKAGVYGVRYPEEALEQLREAGIDYGAWLPNYMAPRAFARFKVTVHIPRRPYVQALPGIPTIRVFEALACGIPLISAPWEDSEGLFTAGSDYLVARSGRQMSCHLHALIRDREMARNLAENGRRTILRRHTCSHRVDELLDIYDELITGRRAAAPVYVSAVGGKPA